MKTSLVVLVGLLSASIALIDPVDAGLGNDVNAFFRGINSILRGGKRRHFVSHDPTLGSRSEVFPELPPGEIVHKWEQVDMCCFGPCEDRPKFPWQFKRKSARIEEAPKSVDVEEKAKLLALLNVGRLHFADKFQIANMHALEMSQELSIVANRLAQECAQDAELMLIDEYEVVPVSLRQPSRVYTAVEIAHLGSAFLNNPIVTKVGFAKVGGCERDADIGYSVVFVLSSSVREKKKPFDVQYGEPGSACSDGFRNLDGLCVLV